MRTARGHFVSPTSETTLWDATGLRSPLSGLVHKANDGRDPFPVLIKRQKVPKDRYNVKSNFSAIYLELSDNEVTQYYRPSDFGRGKIVNIYGRDFTVYDMDNFTKAFYYQNFGETEFSPINDENIVGSKGTPHAKMVIFLFFKYLIFYLI